jgi:gluconate 2-dehydrogenase alpha chain
MTITLKETDAVVIGVGWTGSILARELTKAGLNVVGLERGAKRMPREDFTIPAVRDDLKYAVRQELFQDTQLETVSLRHSPAETALPIRRLGSFLPGTDLGGAGAHWNGMTWRWLPSDHKLRSHITERYGKNAVPEEMTIEDLPVSYDELEPYYDKFEKLCGVSGKAGNLRGKIIDGGNVFEGPRQNDYPNPPLAKSMAGTIMDQACRSLGYHPFQAPSSNASETYTNPEGMTLGACEYCGHCERFGCEANAKASPNVCILPALLADSKFELRTHAQVKELVYDKAARKVTAVRYVDTRSGEEYEQPAGIVILGAYVFNNVLLMLTAGIGEPYDYKTGKGAVGKNYCYQVGAGAVTVFFEDKEINPFMAAGAHGVLIDDFNGDNFDHGGLGFFGGAWIQAGPTNGRPILTRPVPPGTPRWGRDWKQATAKWYNHAFSIGASGCNYAHRENFLDLDPTYRDALGRPLIRLSYNFHDNDYKLSDYIGSVLGRIGKAMNPTVMTTPVTKKGDYSVVPYQSTHNTGGTMTGTDPKTSVVNRYLQSWDADNLFVMGASVFPQNASYNPTGVVGALAYWSANAITTQYLKSPGPLVHA